MRNLTGEFDAKIWAEEFMKLFGKSLSQIDEGLMLSWFANAIMAGYDKAKREALTAIKQEILGKLPEKKDIYWNMKLEVKSTLKGYVFYINGNEISEQLYNNEFKNQENRIRENLSFNECLAQVWKMIEEQI